MAKLSKPQLKKKSLQTIRFLCSSGSATTFPLISDSSSLHLLPLISQPHIFLFDLNCRLVLVAPSTSWYPCPLLFVVAKLYGQSVCDTAERGGLHLPVVDRVREQADAIVEHPLHPKSARAEVIHPHVVDTVGVEVHHLQGNDDAEIESGLIWNLSPALDSPVGISVPGGPWGRVWAGCCLNGALSTWGGNPGCRSQCYGCGYSRVPTWR